MSAQLVEREIRRFLCSAEPEVLCIRGAWGVGKTFACNKYLGEAKASNGIALQRYAYVSLFGVNSLEELRYSIFENTIRTSEIGVEPSLETLQSNTTAAAEKFGRKSLWFLQQLPLVKNYVGGLGPVWFLSVRKTIVCFDDIERRGEKLRVRDVLGLVSNLKEHKGCKILLILNDDAFDSDSEKTDFKTYFDKVVDTSLKFSPTAVECARIALSQSTEAEKLLAECCVKLGISNIRLLKRIERSVRQIEAMLTQFDLQVLKQAVQSLTLLGWSTFEPQIAPSLDYLKKRRAVDVFGGSKEKAVPQDEATWNALLDQYGFSIMDEFDLALLDGIRDGFFDPDSIEKYGSELDKRAKAGKSDSSFSDAWRAYHDSFGDNQNEVLDGLHVSFLRNVQYITPINLNGTVRLFKELGRADQATELIKCYVENRNEDRGFFDLNEYPFGREIDDPDVISAFNKRCASFSNERDPATILREMAKSRGWANEDLQALSTTAVDEYYRIFKNSEGPDLRATISACLQFDTISNASEPMKEISRRAKEALRQIGRESAINASRVRKYGVDVSGGT